MDIARLQSALIRLSQDAELREAVKASSSGDLVLASTAEGAPAMSINVGWFVDQLPTLIPVVFSLVATGGASAFLPALIAFGLKAFNVKPTMISDWLMKILAAVTQYETSQQG
jgi:hypothetical protein